MKRSCLQVEEEIWEHVHHGCALSEDTQRHIEECAECAGALREAGQILQAMIAIRHTPDAPDCRSAVLAGITGGKMVPVWGWAGACAVVAAAAVIAWSMLSVPHPGAQHESGRKMVEQMPVKTNPPAPPLKQSKPMRGRSTDMAESGIGDRPRTATTVDRQPVRRAIKHSRPHPKRPTHIDQPAEDAKMAEKPGNTRPAPDVTQENKINNADRPVAIAIVKWPSRLDDESLDYSYTQHNTQTGETTTCTARRSGNSVEIYMETKDEDKGPRTIKGSVSDEANRNA